MNFGRLIHWNILSWVVQLIVNIYDLILQITDTGQQLLYRWRHLLRL